MLPCARCFFSLSFLSFHFSSPHSVWLKQISLLTADFHLVIMIEEDDKFQDLMIQLHLPQEAKDNPLVCGYDCTLTFGLAFSSMQILDQNIHKLLPAGETDHSPTCARIRALCMPRRLFQQLRHPHQLLWRHLLQFSSIHLQAGTKPYHPSSALMTWNMKSQFTKKYQVKSSMLTQHHQSGFGHRFANRR